MTNQTTTIRPMSSSNDYTSLPRPRGPDSRIGIWIYRRRFSSPGRNSCPKSGGLESPRCSLLISPPAGSIRVRDLPSGVPRAGAGEGRVRGRASGPAAGANRTTPPLPLRRRAPPGGLGPARRWPPPPASLRMHRPRTKRRSGGARWLRRAAARSGALVPNQGFNTLDWNIEPTKRP